MNNNQQNSPTPGQSEPATASSTKKIDKKIITIIVLAIIAGISSYVALTKNPTVEPQPSPTPKIAEQKVKNYDLATAISLAPSTWGQMSESSIYTNYKGKFESIHSVQFSNNVSAVFQDGVGLIAYSKVKEQDKCVNYNKKFGTSGLMYDYSETDVCYITEYGIYNLETKKSVILNQEDPFTFTKSLRISPFVTRDNNDKKNVGIFSPKGTYFARAANVYEGCAMIIINTATGEAIQNQSNEGRYIDTAFSCDPVIDFSDNEKTFTLRVNWAGMMSPGIQFSAIQGNKQFEILPILITKKFDFDTTEVNPVNDFKVTLVSDTEVKFDVLKTNQYYTKGSYSYNLVTNKITQTSSQNWKDSVLAEFSSLIDWNQSTPDDWQLADHSNDAEQLKNYGTGKILLLSKSFNADGCKSDCSAEGKAQNDLISSIKSSLAKNGWGSVPWANEPSAYTDYLYIKDNHPIILQVGTRSAVSGGLYVNLEFQY